MTELEKRRQHALELSEKTNKAIGRLCLAENCFCALGVLCESYRQQTGQGKWEEAFDGYRFRHSTTGPLGFTVPDEVLEFFGLVTEHAKCIASTNDNFPQQPVKEILETEFRKKEAA